MEFRIADTFTDSLAKLAGDEQKAVKTTAFDLQVNPASPGMSFHKLDRSKDPNFWSVRVSRDLRLIVHKSASSLLLCYVDHHDDAYAWAERRKLEIHPKTGAAQLVEIRHRVQEIPVPVYVEQAPATPVKPLLFSGVSDDDLLGYGVPREWLKDVKAANEDTLLELADHLPAEAAEALLELATGGTPVVASQAVESADPFEHPDAQRRFRVMRDVEELQRALAYPWEKWTIFLHPAQRQWVERDYNGPARVAGSAGTGKTIVALHRAVHLARTHPDARVLLATFSETLASALHTKLRRLIGNEPKLGERVDVYSLDAIGERLYQKTFGRPDIVSSEEIRTLLKEAIKTKADLKVGLPFLSAEWSDVVDAWQISDWESYRDVRRLGRKTRLPEAQRAKLWELFERVRKDLERKGRITRAGMFQRLAGHMAQRSNPPFDFVVIDEAQDITVPQLGFLAAMAGDRPNGLFFAGDLGQRIFQTPFSWKALGVDVRGRSRTLHINYRTSHQIRMQADRLLGPEVSDVDGNLEDRRGTISAFNGAPPKVCEFPDAQQEEQALKEWLQARTEEGIKPEEIGVFVRSQDELERAKAAVGAASLPFQILDERTTPSGDRVSISTMHLAKGLEFRAVAVMACDDEVIPSQERIESAGDEADLEEIYNTERHLLYVACTRARDHLYVSGVRPISEFLEDLDLSRQKST